MNQLRLLLFLLFISCSVVGSSQQGFLFIKKGIHKKRTYTEGDDLHIRLGDGSYRKGVITLLRNDTVFINGEPIPRPLITDVLIKKRRASPPPDVKTLLLVAGGAALTTTGLTLSKQASFKQALTAGLTIGFGPIIINYIGSRFMRLIKRHRFHIGRKFRLQVLDFYITPGKRRYF